MYRSPDLFTRQLIILPLACLILRTVNHICSFKTHLFILMGVPFRYSYCITVWCRGVLLFNKWNGFKLIGTNSLMRLNCSELIPFIKASNYIVLFCHYFVSATLSCCHLQPDNESLSLFILKIIIVKEILVT